MNAENQNCPSCGYKIGTPLDDKGQHYDANKKDGICFCIRCCATIVMTPGKPPREASHKELFAITLMRPNEILRMMHICLHLNAILPRIDAERN